MTSRELQLKSFAPTAFMEDVFRAQMHQEQEQEAVDGETKIGSRSRQANV